MIICRQPEHLRHLWPFDRPVSDSEPDWVG